MPLIVAGAGIEKGGFRDDLVSGIDISAASLATAGIEVPAYMEGRDFLSNITNLVNLWWRHGTVAITPSIISGRLSPSGLST